MTIPDSRDEFDQWLNRYYKAMAEEFRVNHESSGEIHQNPDGTWSYQRATHPGYHWRWERLTHSDIEFLRAVGIDWRH